jgi:hypothetical protein
MLSIYEDVLYDKDLKTGKETERTINCKLRSIIINTPINSQRSDFNPKRSQTEYKICMKYKIIKSEFYKILLNTGLIILLFSSVSHVVSNRT